MPYAEEMNWEKAKRRWHRYHKGVMYRVPASKLGPEPTREATRSAANDWWKRKEAELNGYVEEDLTEQLAQPRPMTVSNDLIVLPSGPMTRDEAARLLAPKAEPGRSLKENGESFLKVKCGGMRPRTFEEIAAYIHSLDGTIPVESIDEDFIERAYLKLEASKLSPGRKKKHWGFLRRFIRYLWERRVIETLPRNLDAHKFKVRPKKIKEYPIEKVRDMLATLKSRLRLYALLTLNCGMVNVDIAALRKDEVDLREGTITRKRVKTSAHDSVPDVTYQLWPETLERLKEHQSSHRTLFLTNMRGNALLETRIEGGKSKRFDMIVQQWRRADPGIPLKALRAFSASLLEAHPTYGRFAAHFLGHSPRGVAARHYVVPSKQLFCEALGWLHEQIYPEPGNS
jgi:integrase